LLEARALDLLSNAWLTANGGAGAEAADDNQAGNPGEDGQVASNNAAQGGQNGANNGGDGANGASTGPPGNAQGGKDTGGGGGGAAGRIYLRAAGSCNAQSHFSPAFTSDAGC
jgi:hypothetical protein